VNTTILTALAAVLALVFADWLLGVLVAVRAGTFQFQCLPHQLESTVLPIAGSLTVLAFLQSVVPTQYAGALAGGFAAAAATYVPRAVLDIVSKAEALLQGTTPASTPQVPPPAA
jgi:hypothetical protein